MLGNPKYKYGEEVSFKIGNDIHKGKIYIIDEYGTWEDDSNVSYDIMVGNCLYKHVKEDIINVI